MPNDRSVDDWIRANPYVLVNTMSLGTGCGRYATLEEAKRALAERGVECRGVSGTRVFFAQPVQL